MLPTRSMLGQFSSAKSQMTAMRTRVGRVDVDCIAGLVALAIIFARSPYCADRTSELASGDDQARRIPSRDVREPARTCRGIRNTRAAGPHSVPIAGYAAT